MEGPISTPIKPANVRTRTNAATGDAQDGARRGRKRSNNNTSGYTMYAKKTARRNTNRVRRIAYTPYKSAATITTVNVTRAALASHRTLIACLLRSRSSARTASLHVGNPTGKKTADRNPPDLSVISSDPRRCAICSLLTRFTRHVNATRLIGCHGPATLRVQRIPAPAHLVHELFARDSPVVGRGVPIHPVVEILTLRLVVAAHSCGLRRLT